MHVCLKFCKTLQIVVNRGRQPRLTVDPHSDVHLHENLGDLDVTYPCSILRGLERSVLRDLR